MSGEMVVQFGFSSWYINWLARVYVTTCVCVVLDNWPNCLATRSKARRINHTLRGTCKTHSDQKA